MLACSFDMSASNALGLLCAFGSAVVFVTSNIFFKKIMPSSTSSGSSATTSHKLDKVNLLFYSSGMAFLLMIPIWVWTDLPSLLASSDNTHVGHPPHGSPSPHGYSTPVNFFLNGTVHFLQNVLAFVLLAQTSPVTYSIASLIKRVAVICIAVVWFAQSVHPVQGFGICLTFVGLWCYNNAKSDVERGEKKVRRVENAREGVLPSTRAQLVEAGEEEVGWEMEKEKEKERGEKVEVKSTGVPVATMVYTRPRAYTQHTPTTTAHRHHLHSFAPPPPLPSLRHTTPTAATQDSVSHPPAVLSTSKTLPTTYSQTHPNAHPNLHIQIAPPPPPPVTLPSKNVHNDNSNNNNHSEVRTKTSKAIMGGEPTLSPIESYPSPPLSEDSPIEEEQGLKDGLGGTPWMKQRRATITGHGHHGHANGLSGTRGQSQTVVVNA